MENGSYLFFFLFFEKYYIRYVLGRVYMKYEV